MDKIPMLIEHKKIKMDIRRIVTASNKNGESYIKEDKIADNRNFPLKSLAPDFKVINLWTTSDESLIPEYKTDPVSNQKSVPVTPEKNHTSFRIVNFPPENYLSELNNPENIKKFKEDAGFKEGELQENSKHPFMHATKTIDYAIVLSGEIYLLLDKEETLLKEGDVVVQCGTNHAWNNRSREDCKMAFVVLGTG